VSEERKPPSWVHGKSPVRIWEAEAFLLTKA